MPKTRTLTDYPYEAFGRLLMMVANTREAQTLPCPTGMEAASIRGDLYAFRRAARGNITKALHYGIDPDLIERVKIKVVPEGLRLYHVDDQPAVKAIEELLAQAGAPRPSGLPPADATTGEKMKDAGESMARVLAGLKVDDGKTE